MFKVGFYEKEITPPLGCSRPGGLVTNKTLDVMERLHAKAIAMDLDGSSAIIISVDSVSGTPELCQPVARRVSEFTGVPFENISVCATHCHTAIPVPGRNSESDVPDEPYFDVLIRIVADAGTLAYQRMVPATVKYNKSIEKGLTFNRNYWMKDGSARTNPGWQNPDIVRPFGPVDEEFINLFFFGEDGKPLGVITSFSCHNCSVSGVGVIPYSYSADYAGIIGDRLKDVYGDDFVTVFLTGASGDLNHIDNFREDKVYKRGRYLDIGEQLAASAVKQMESAEEVKVDTLRATKKYIPIKRRGFADGALEEAKWLYENIPFESLKNFDISHPDSQDYKRVKAKKVIDISAMPDPYPCAVQTIRLGDVMLFAISGELYTQFGLNIKAASPTKKNIIATISDGIPTYIPVPEAFGTAIYEAHPTTAVFIPEAGDIMVDEAIRQANELMK